MGNRAEIHISGPEINARGEQIPVPFEVFVYTHWHGDDMPRFAAQAIDTVDGDNRLSQLSYFARVCVDVVSSFADGATTGAAVSNKHMDGYKCVHYRMRKATEGYTIHVELSGYEHKYPELEGRQMEPVAFVDAVNNKNLAGQL
jgi:hypothetical protein